MSQVLLNQIPYFTYHNKTLFLPLKNIYMECFVLIQGEPKLHPLLCMIDNCHRNKGCTEKLAKRVLYWFEKVEPKAELMVTYFKYPDMPNSLRAGLFYRDMREPRVIKLNISAFEKFKREGVEKRWQETSEYKDLDNFYKVPTILPIESLIRK